MTTRLITIYHESSSKSRNGEVELCLEVNEGAFDEVVVVAQQCERIRDFRGMWIVVQHRQTYFDLIDAAKFSLPGDLVVLANSDIMFTKHAISMFEHITSTDAICLTRWDLTPQGIRLFNRPDSQDVWVFRGRPRLKTANYSLGMPGCDNRFAHDLLEAGYNLTNPAKDIRVCHLHLTGYRPENKPQNRVAPPYIYIKPARIGEPATIVKGDKISKRASSY